MIEVRVNAQVAFSRIDGGGTRRVRCADGTVHVFSSVPQLFAELPPEVAADPYLTKRQVAEAAPGTPATPATPATAPESSGPADNKKGDRVQVAGDPPPATAQLAPPAPLVDGVPIADVDLDGLAYPALVQLAKDMGVATHGKKKDDLREELRAEIVAHYVVAPADITTEPPATEA